MAASFEHETVGAPALVVCKWCESPMRESAVRCARCRRYRNDIHNERFLVYVLSGFAVGLAMTGLNQRWWAHSLFDAFSPERFASSWSGWMIVGLLTLSCALYFRVSRKLASWFWV